MRNWDYRLLLAARREPDARRADDRRLHRRGARVPRLAAARGRRRSRRSADHVRHRRRAPAHRVRARLAARLRGLEAGARRQRRLRAVPARRLRRGAGLPSTPARKMGLAGARGRLAAAQGAHRVPRESLAAPGRRHLGGARRAPPLHALEGHGLGRDRPRGARASRSSASAATRGRAMLPHLRALRERIHDEVCERGFNPRVGAFTQSYGSDALDASVLVIPHVGFLPAQRSAHGRARSRRSRRACCATASCCATPPRHGADGLPGTEGAFLACSFWLADNYAFAGRIDEAEALFERLLGAAQPPRAARRGVRAEAATPDRQLPAGVLAPRAHLHRARHRLRPPGRRGARPPPRRRPGGDPALEPTPWGNLLI